MIAEIMSIFQPSLRNLDKAKERKIDQSENEGDLKRRNELDRILKEGLSPNSFKKSKNSDQ